MTDLQRLQDQREQVFIAELVALIHNIGKLDPNFIRSVSRRPQDVDDDTAMQESGLLDGTYWFKHISPLASNFANALNNTVLDQVDWQQGQTEAFIKKVKRAYKRIETSVQQGHGPLEFTIGNVTYDYTVLLKTNNLSINGESWTLTDLLSLFWDDFYYRPYSDTQDTDYLRESALTPFFGAHYADKLPLLLNLAHGEVSGVEKNADNALYPKNSEALKAILPKKSRWGDQFKASAFGYDTYRITPQSFVESRLRLLETIKTTVTVDKGPTQPEKRRQKVLGVAQEELSKGLGDTQWPLNEIDLWDYAYNIASLYKSAIAQAVLTERTPTVDEMRWRFLGVRFDGLAFYSNANHVTDVLGRRDQIEAALNEVQTLLEETYPLGNQIYRDDNGSVFVVPDIDLDSLITADGYSLRQEIHKAFATAAGPLNALDGELLPYVRLSDAMRGKKLILGDFLEQDKLALCNDPLAMQRWWDSMGTHRTEKCEICGVRPQGYEPFHLPNRLKRISAEDRDLCYVCLNRRGRRAYDWHQNHQNNTIWTGEVADGNGRMALIVGQFDLARWLDGTLIPTISKPVSFARIRRCWETTQEFWQAVDKTLIPDVLGQDNCRWRIIPRSLPENIIYQNTNVFELDLNGQRLPVMLVAEDLAQTVPYFITIDNLEAVALRWNFKKSDGSGDIAKLKTQVDAHLNDGWELFKPDDERKGKTRIAEATGLRMVACTEEDITYTPHIDLLQAPARYMALVPADKAMEITLAIQKKYTCEMSKVQDRLPLHLSVVITSRRTPLAVVMESGRSMLGRDTQWQSVSVKQTLPQTKLASHLINDTHFNATAILELDGPGKGWKPVMTFGQKMGDGQQPDLWYIHPMKHAPSNSEKLDLDDWLEMDAVLNVSKSFCMAQSTFDFEYLDTSARRFAIDYDEQGSRRGWPCRPLNLLLLPKLQNLWDVLSNKMATSQWLALDTLIEAKRQLWQETRTPATRDEDDVFVKFVEQAFSTATTKEGKSLTDADIDLLRDAAVFGWYHDAIELYHEALKIK